MKKILLLSLMTLGLSSYSCITYAAVDKQELAQEVAHCYVAHKKEQTHMYTSGKAENMKALMNELVGNDTAKQKIQIANDTQAQENTGSLSFVVIANVKRYCSKLDQRLANYKKSQLQSD